MKTRRFVVLGLVVCSFVAMIQSMANEVTPAAVRLSCKRTVQSTANVTNTVFYQGDYITLTNSVMYTDAAGTVPQDLTNCVITVIVGSPGNTSVTQTATGYIITTNTGIWGAAVLCPNINPAYIQVTVSNTYNYTYPMYRIQTQAKLQ